MLYSLLSRDELILSPTPTITSIASFATFACLAAVFLTGCSNPPSDPSTKLLGKWKVSIRGGGSDGMLEMGLAAGMPEVFSDAEFKRDGTFAFKVFAETHGTWKFLREEGNALVILVKNQDSPEYEARYEFADNDHFTQLPPENATGASKSLILKFARAK